MTAEDTLPGGPPEAHLGDASDAGYGVRDVARLFDLSESRLRYWAQTGFLGPRLRRAGKPCYSFSDLIAVRAAKELLDAGLPLKRVRRNLDALRAALPGETNPVARLRVTSDGDRLIVIEDDAVFEPETGQLLLDFTVRSLGEQVAEILPFGSPGPAPIVSKSAASSPDDRSRPAVAEPRTAYDAFLLGCELDEKESESAQREAERAYRRALELDPQLAAAATNLGNLHARRGERGLARERFEQALRLDPEQPEARYNLAILLLESGRIDDAIAELRRALAGCEEFADAHYNLAMALLQVGGTTQAKLHLRRFLDLTPDPAGSFAHAASERLDALEQAHPSAADSRQATHRSDAD